MAGKLNGNGTASEKILLIIKVHFSIFSYKRKGNYAATPAHPKDDSR